MRKELTALSVALDGFAEAMSVVIQLSFLRIIVLSMAGLDSTIGKRNIPTFRASQ